MPPHSSSTLLSLPEPVWREVVSWSPDDATANALLSTCSTLRWLRSDPAAAALLLTRRARCQEYSAALDSCLACDGGPGAVIQQVLQLLRAGPDSGGPHAAPPPLLQAMLFASAASGDAHSVRALFALPCPPSVDARAGRALLSALGNGPHLAAMQALLECGASPCGHNMRVVRWAARTPDRLPGLQLLLRHCPAADHAEAVKDALYTATDAENLPTLACLLPLAQAAGVTLQPPALSASMAGKAAVLQQLVEHHAYSVGLLSQCLARAANCGYLPCVRVLLACGADPNDPVARPLLWAVRRMRRDSAPVAEEVRREAVALLLRHGGAVTPAVREAAGGMGLASVVALLRAAEEEEQEDGEAVG